MPTGSGKEYSLARNISKSDFVAKLIEDAGLKGCARGGAQVSEKHAGFVVNKGDATAKDVCELTDYIKSEVMEKFGVGLELEVVKVGF